MKRIRVDLNLAFALLGLELTKGAEEAPIRMLGHEQPIGSVRGMTTYELNGCPVSSETAEALMKLSSLLDQERE